MSKILFLNSDNFDISKLSFTLFGGFKFNGFGIGPSSLSCVMYFNSQIEIKDFFNLSKQYSGTFLSITALSDVDIVNDINFSIKNFTIVSESLLNENFSSFLLSVILIVIYFI